MRKHLSVFSFFARCSLLKVLVILFAGGLIQRALVYFAVANYPQTLEFAPEIVLGRAFIPVVFIIEFILIYVILSLTGNGLGSKAGYTVSRLQITEEQFFVLQAVYNFLIFLLVWLYEAYISYRLMDIYSLLIPAQAYFPKDVFLAYYRNEFLHSIIPLKAIHLWVRNLILCAALGVASAQFSFKQRQGKFSFFALAMPVFAVLFFAPELENWANSVVVITVSVVVILCHLIERALKEEAK